MSPVPLFLTISAAVGVVGLAICVKGVLRWRAARDGKRVRAFALLAVGVGLAGFAGLLALATREIPYFQVLPICQSNLRGIWCGVCMYQEAHREYPGSLQDLVRVGYCSDKLISCVFSYPRQSYVYVSGLAATDPPTWVIAFDPPDCHPRPYRFVLYLSGETRFLSDAEVQREYQRTAAEFRAARGFPPKLIRDGGE